MERCLEISPCFESFLRYRLKQDAFREGAWWAPLSGSQELGPGRLASPCLSPAGPAVPRSSFSPLNCQPIAETGDCLFLCGVWHLRGRASEPSFIVTKRHPCSSVYLGEQRGKISTHVKMKTWKKTDLELGLINVGDIYLQIPKLQEKTV